MRANFSFFIIWLKRARSVFGFLFNATTLVGALITIFATSVGAGVLAWIFRNKVLMEVLFAFAFGCALATATMVVVYLRASPVKWLLRGYRWVSAEYLYRIHDNARVHHSQSITILVEALRRGVDHFENRYRWTGEGREETPNILSRGHSMMGPPVRSRFYKYYYVHLGRELAVGERSEVKLLQELYDDKKSFEPFLSKYILEPLDHLVLRVMFPSDCTPTEVYQFEYIGPYPSQQVVSKIPGKFDEATREIRWDLRSPVFGHIYEIEWKWQA